MKIKIPRKYRPWWEWECYRAGFFSTTPPKGLDADRCREMYRDFLSDLSRFDKAMSRVVVEWPNSCEHFLTNPTMNKIAWFGQAAACIEMGVPAMFRAGFKLLTPEQQEAANALANNHYERWTETYVSYNQGQ